MVTNACEAISGKGKITITTRNQLQVGSDEHVGDQEPQQIIILEVADTGCGIPEDILGHIFEPFFTKKTLGRSGTGLGLAVVWNTIKEHEGAISVKSGGQGTVFTVTLPACRGEVSVEDAGEDLEELKSSGSILVIDDEEQQREIAKEILTTLGYDVSTAGSGREAVELCRSQEFDLLILDMIMPSGMNGYQTYLAIKEFRPYQKAIVSSGFSQTVDVEKTKKLGAGGFIKKPYTMAELGRMVLAEIERKKPLD